MLGGSPHAPATAIAVKECLDRVRPNTWRFDLTLQMPLFSSPDDVCAVFRSILDEAQFSAGRCSIHKLKQCSFAYGVLEKDVAQLQRFPDIYMHPRKSPRQLFELGYSTIEFMVKSNGQQRCPANMATGRSIRTSRTSSRPATGETNASSTGLPRVRLIREGARD